MVAGCIRQVVVLCSNYCMGIGLGSLSFGRLRQCSSYRGGRISRFDCSKISYNKYGSHIVNYFKFNCLLGSAIP